jgi:isoquinoline 1-oxidoreductase beta subunit
MGTGIKGDLPLVLADELEADWNRVKVVQGQGDRAMATRTLTGRAAPGNLWADAVAGRTPDARNRCSADLERSARRMPPKFLVVHASSGRKLAYGDSRKSRRRRCRRQPGAAQGPERLAHIGKPHAVVDLKDIVGPRDLWHRLAPGA